MLFNELLGTRTISYDSRFNILPNVLRYSGTFDCNLTTFSPELPGDIVVAIFSKLKVYHPLLADQPGPSVTKHSHWWGWNDSVIFDDIHMVVS